MLSGAMKSKTHLITTSIGVLLMVTLVVALGTSTERLDSWAVQNTNHIARPDQNGNWRAHKEFSMDSIFFYNISEKESGYLHTISTRAENAMRISKGGLSTQHPLQIASQPLNMSRRPKSASKIEKSPSAGQVSGPTSGQDHLHMWETIEVPGPDVGDKDTVVNLAKMCNDAYIEAPTQPDWLNTSLGFNHSDTFGWKNDGLRGHVFTDKMNETVIVSFKGTSIDPRDGWASKDKFNDNQLFSCCCATQRPPPFWYPSVCGCRTGTYQCNATCITEEIMQEDRYYYAAFQVMLNVTSTFPDANLWVVGHSLGGAMASLMGLTFNIPSVSYESPPEKLAAQRLGLAIPPYTGAFHIGNTADPVYMGACNGYFSSCSIAGFAFESQCHSGQRCVYDTVGDKGWHVSVNNHRLNVVIPDVLEAYNSTPSCQADDDCVDCYNWDFHG